VRSFIKFFSYLSAALALLFLARLLDGFVNDGFANGAGLNILLFELFAVIASMLAVLLGYVGLRLDKSVQSTNTMTTKAPIWIGGLVIAVLVTILIFG